MSHVHPLTAVANVCNRRVFRALQTVCASLALSIAALAVATPTNASTILIDDFEDPVGEQGWAMRFFNPVNPYVMEWQEAPVVGGTILGDERELQVEVLSPLPMERFAAVGAIGDGKMEFSANSVSRVTGILLYDGLADLPVLPGSPIDNSLGLNADLTASGANGFKIYFDSVDAAPGMSSIDLRITVTGPGGPATRTVMVPESGTPFTVEIPYATFNTTAPFSTATSLEFAFNVTNPQPAVDFSISRIEAIPEPSSIVLVCLGLAGLALARLRRRAA
jgi:hypothetical protein